MTGGTVETDLRYEFKVFGVPAQVKVDQWNNKAPKVQMPRCSSMYASMQLADAYDST